MVSHRMERIEEAIGQSISEIVLQELRDPRIPMIFTVTSVKVTKDLAEARIYFSQLPDSDDAIDATLDALEHASGHIRAMLGHRIRLKTTPKVMFFFDPGRQHAQRIDTILNELKAAEHEKASGE
ncbi:30S ribosome-binding factor RbfA [bacterium]|nr:30S ribosome-binding factor RbfA [bacterium]